MTEEQQRLAELSKSPLEPVRREVAINPATPIPVLVEMFKAETNKLVKLALAENPATPVWVLAWLAQDPDSSVSLMARIGLTDKRILIRDRSTAASASRWLGVF